MTNPLLAQFVAEAADLLAEVDDGLLRLEADPHDTDLINAVFRAAHTFKGSSGLFELPELTRLTHAAEDLLDAVRADRLALDGDMVDDLLAAFDAVRSWMPVIEATGSVPADAAAVGAGISGRLRVPLGEKPADAAQGGGGDHTAAPAASAAPAVLPGWVRDFPEPVLAELATWLDVTGASLRAVDYQPDAGCFFRGEDPLNTLRALPAVEHLHLGVPSPLPGIADVDEYECFLRLQALTRASAQEIAYVFRYVPDQFTDVEVTGPALRRLLDGTDTDDVADAVGQEIGATSGSAAGIKSAEAQALLPLLDAQRRLLAMAPPAASTARSAVDVVRRVLAIIDAGEQPHTALTAALDGDHAPLRSWLDALLDGLTDARPALTVPAPRTADPSEVVAHDDGPAPVRAAARTEEASSGHRILKVEQGKVDRLLDLVGELVVAKNSLPYVADAAEEEGHRALARRIKDEYAVVSRVSEELQQAVMDVRMLPVSTAFARVPRLVRDLSRKLGKQVRLVQEGEETAADKDVIESLAEPLVHLVRNSLDHGIETPAERQAAGKPGEATLVLRAVPDGDAVVIEVIDDGKGVDTDAVRRKAYERGIITEADLDTLSESEAAELIFAAGFSTAAVISDVSGRGVGMDAVRSSIERLGGSVSLDSRRGLGMTVRLRLPLTMAVSRVLLITAGGQRFGVPIDEVVETVSVAREDITRVAGHQVLVLREDVVPLVPLDALLDLPERVDAAELNVLVVRTPTGPLGIVVDRFHQNTDVILKPLEGLLTGTPGYCGTAMLGDGLVLLVLDVKELNDHAAASR